MHWKRWYSPILSCQSSHPRVAAVCVEVLEQTMASQLQTNDTLSCTAAMHPVSTSRGATASLQLCATKFPSWYISWKRFWQCAQLLSPNVTNDFVNTYSCTSNQRQGKKPTQFHAAKWVQKLGQLLCIWASFDRLAPWFASAVTFRREMHCFSQPAEKAQIWSDQRVKPASK